MGEVCHCLCLRAFLSHCQYNNKNHTAWQTHSGALNPEGKENERGRDAGGGGGGEGGGQKAKKKKKKKKLQRDRKTKTKGRETSTEADRYTEKIRDSACACVRACVRTCLRVCVCGRAHARAFQYAR